ncbi:MAG: radical SAM family heme chaperone HemW [Oceanospirillaceae bacterium]|jgi:oxygen-independent coproporphyrinogen-3 oxidase|nr:radical SAM family heme chaperone HemW [Oceanospirillaceae bacterium]MBT4443921.1 radical SAM family heme chaperone HemW [Oceanospirillaceae bacterium]MBT6078333.1 radical SAM family heme chaperone HemW [Oceanospirillaceae bacterium]
MHTLPTLSLYIHIPWCVRKCPYCDFNSHATQAGDDIPEATYIAALLQDLATELKAVAGRRLHSIFIGGGTPSLMSAEGIGDILTFVKTHIDCESDTEVTLEANPGTFEQAKFAGFLEQGVNRLSIGVQSFDDDCLQALGRIHSARQAKLAIGKAQALGFERINLDLMHGLPGQTLASGLADLQQALDFGTDHLSWYQLTIEPNTEFHSRPPNLPDEEVLVDIQDQGQGLIEAAGLSQYEISAYSKPANQARHNLNYWRFGDYIGVGAGAHGKVSYWQSGSMVIERRVKLRQPKAYMSAINALSSSHIVTPEELQLEFFMNALRLQAGVSTDDYLANTGQTLSNVKGALVSARKAGLMMPDRLQASPLGWRFLNDLLTYFE